MSRERSASFFFSLQFRFCDPQTLAVWCSRLFLLFFIAIRLAVADVFVFVEELFFGRLFYPLDFLDSFYERRPNDGRVIS